GGAGGGGAGGVAALRGAPLRPGAPLVLEARGFDARLAGAGLCVAGEGRLDEQSLVGKAPAAVAAACRTADVPCVAVCGEVALLPGPVRRMGLAAALPVNRRLLPRDAALAECGTDLAAMG